MGQLIFFGLFIIALLAGAFAYFAPSQKAINPMKFVMEDSGYNSLESLNNKKIRQLNILTKNGLMQIRKKMDDIALEQNKFIDAIQDQQQLLKNASKEAEDIMLEAQKSGGNGNRDALRLKSLAMEMQDEQRLLVAHGQELIAINDQLTKGRLWIADQIDLAKINNENSLQTLQQRYSLLESQTSGFFDQINRHNQEVRDQMNKMQDQLKDLTNNAMYDSALQQQNSKERIGLTLDKEHEDMIKLADSEERSRNLLNDAKGNFVNSNKLFNDSLQQTQDLIEQERQKAEDQEWANQQHMADQQQRIQDQQAQQAQRKQ